MPLATNNSAAKSRDKESFDERAALLEGVAPPPLTMSVAIYILTALFSPRAITICRGI